MMRSVIKQISLTILFLITVMLVLPAPAQAQAPVDLQLNGEGAASWDISNLQPGDTGMKILTLRNAGTRIGFITIWLSDIVNSEGDNPEPETGNTDEPGELGDVLLLTLYSSRLSTNVSLPLNVNSFPQSNTAPEYIKISPVGVGRTIDLTWEWQLPVTADNSVQGDSITFTINYLLTEYPLENGGGGSAVSPAASLRRTLLIITPEQQLRVAIQSDGTIMEPFSVTAISGQVILSFERGTRIITSDGSLPERLEMTVSEEVSPPQGMAIVSPAYRFLFYTGKDPRQVSFSQPVRLVLHYDVARLPPNTTGLSVAYYSEEDGWVHLEPVSGFIAGEGQVAAVVNHFTIFAVLAQLAPAEPAIVPPLSQTETPPAALKPPLLPMRFEVSNLEIAPDKMSPGKSVSIRARITNVGELSGERNVTLKINGLFVDSKLVKLAPKQNKNVSFTVIPHEVGDYEVEVGGLRTSFTVTEGEAPLYGIDLFANRGLTYAALFGIGAVVVVVTLLLLTGRKTKSKV